MDITEEVQYLDTYQRIITWIFLQPEQPSILEYEQNETWFIETIDSLYKICPRASHLSVAKFVTECWRHKKKQLIDVEVETGIKDYLDYPDFHEHI